MEPARFDRSGDMAAFVAIAHAGSLTGAARALGLTPSAVSRMVSRIEQRLGVRLVMRTTRVVRLTPEGEAYANAACRILAEMEAVENALADRATPRGHIRVSAATAHGRMTIVPLIGAFTRQHPDISVEILLSDEVVDVPAGEADIAIRFGPLADSPLTARRLGVTGRTVVASPAYLARHGTPQTPDALKHHNCLDFSFRRIEQGWPFRVEGRDILLPVHGSITANNGETLVHLALQGLGITRVGNFHIPDALASGALVPVLEAFNPRDQESIHAVFMGGPKAPARIRAFVDFLSAHYPQAPQTP